jgi:hypothetical protein
MHKFAGWLRERSFSIKFRRVITGWPSYQHVPNGSLGHLVRLKVRVLSTLVSSISRTPLSEIFLMIFQKIEIEGSKDKVIVIANGPSASALTKPQLSRFRGSGGKIAAMNGYVFSDLAEEFPPDLYFAADPDIWSAPKDNDWKYRERIRSLSSNEWKNTIIVQPIHQPKLIDAHANYIYLTQFSSAGLFPFSNPLVMWGLAPSTALLAFSLVTKIGFKEVYFAGMDGDSYRKYSSNNLTEIKWSDPEHHFYAVSKSQTDEYSGTSFDGILFNNELIPSLADALYAEAILRRDFRRISRGKFINVTPSNFCDIGVNACLLG